MSRMSGVAVVCMSLACIAAGCGGGSSPTGPSAPPPVAGGPTPAPTPAPPAPSPAATPAPTPAPSPAPPPDAVLRSATIRGANGHSASGSARILRENGRFVLELGADFRIDSGNNDVYLAREGDRIDSRDLNLGNMRALTGRQRYDLPDDGSAYAHVILWCRPFRIPIGTGALR